MDFFNSLLIRITLAVIGGIFYAFLTYMTAVPLNPSYEWAIIASVFVYLFYLSSRLLLLFSGIDSPYYSKRTGSPRTSPEKNSFYSTAQWVGKFYHHHDTVLFAFLGILSVGFLISLIIDGSEGNPFGNTIQHLWSTFSLLH